MQIREYIHHFITLCFIFTIVTLPAVTLSAQEKADSLYRGHTSLSPLSETPLIRFDSLIPAQTDTVRTDTLSADSVTEPKPLFKDVISYEAQDSIRFSIDQKKVFLYGAAKVKYLSTELKAQYIILDMDRKEAFASGLPDSAGVLAGTPLFSDGGQEFESKELKYNFETKKGFVKEIITQEGEGYIQGKLTKKLSDSVYCVKDGWYTTCDRHDHPDFYIRMNKAKMIKDKKVIAGFSNLVIADVPLPIAVPFAFFPITKKGTSGVIMPTYGEERMRGFNLRNGGYYFAISDYIDLSLTGDIYTNGSWGANIITNYRKRYKFNGNFNFSISRNHTSEKGLPDYSESKDWSLRWSHSQDAKANPYSTFSASVDISSANNNYYNATNINDIANQRKQSSISWSKKWPEKPFSLTAAFNHNQNSRDSSISVSFPNMNFRMTQIYPFRKKGKGSNLKWYDNIGVSYSAELRNSIQTKEDELFKTPLSKWNNGFKHSIPLSTTINLIKDVSLTPSFNYDGVLFLNSIEKNWVRDTAGGPGHVETDTINGLHYAHNYRASVSLGYNPTIYGMYMFKPNSKIYAIRHVIRPSISVSYLPKLGVKNSKYEKVYYDDDGAAHNYSIFENKIYSIARTPEKASGSVQLTLDNNLEMKVRNDKDTTGKEEFKKIKLLESLKISASYDMFADSLNWSTIRISARTKIFRDKMNIDLTATLDPYLMNADLVKVNKYNGGLGRLTNVTLTTGWQFSSDNGEKKKEKNDLVGGFYDKYTDFEVPWSFSVDYNLNYSQSYMRNPEPGATRALSKGNLTQMLRVNGDFSLTPKWKIGFSSGYDFANHEVTATSFNISRDLHCWDMAFSCIPFGTHQSYNFQINVRSSLLRDLKLTKRESWYDTGFYQ